MMYVVEDAVIEDWRCHFAWCGEQDNAQVWFTVSAYALISLCYCITTLIFKQAGDVWAWLSNGCSLPDLRYRSQVPMACLMTLQPTRNIFLATRYATIEKQLLTNLQVGQKSLESRKGITTVKHFQQKIFSISLWLLANSAPPATAGEAGLQWRREGARAAAPDRTAFEEAKIWNLAFVCIAMC